MKKLVDLLQIYHHYHTKPITKLTHFIGVPLILFAIQIFLSGFVLVNISLAWVAAFLLTAYYLTLDVSLGFWTGICLFILTYFAGLITHYGLSLFSIMLAIILFVLGWVIQFIGHYFEGNKPAFLSNVWQLFVAPIFLVAEIFFYFGYRKGLKQLVEKSGR